MSITVYSKPACVQCTATTRALDRQGIDYTIVDVSTDDAGEKTFTFSALACPLEPPPMELAGTGPADS